MEERTRQMKLKMNKYKPGAGSDSRLEQDYHKVCVCFPASSCSDRPCAVCVEALRHMLHFTRHKHAHISTTCMQSRENTPHYFTHNTTSAVSPFC